jgi:hypothetical protein
VALEAALPPSAGWASGPVFRRQDALVPPADRRAVLLTYVHTGATLAGWETFLIQYRDLLTALEMSGVAYVGLEHPSHP